MSRAQQIRDYLNRLPRNQEDTYVPLDFDDMVRSIGVGRDTLVKQMSGFVHLGKLEWVKDDSGRVIGFNNLNFDKKRRVAQPQAMRAPGGQVEPRPLRRIVPTPELDRVYAVRSAMNAFVEQFAGMVDEARLREAMKVDTDKASEYVAEGVSLMERNRFLEERNRELNHRVEELERENGYLKKRNNNELRGALQAVGVTHGEQ